LPRWRQGGAALSLFLEDFLEILDPELAASIDLSDAKLLDKEAFTDFPQGEYAEADLVVEAKARVGEPRTILVHAETEGEFRQTIDERVFRYSIHLRLKYGHRVISIVLFLTGGKVSGLETRVYTEEVDTLEVHRFKYLAFSLSRNLAEEYVDRPPPFAAALAALMRSKIWDEVEKKLHCLEAVSRAEVDEARKMVLANIVETYVE
jgi:hypothetical protein